MGSPNAFAKFRDLALRETHQAATLSCGQLELWRTFKYEFPGSNTRHIMQTQAILESHLPCDVASLTHEYLISRKFIEIYKEFISGRMRRMGNHDFGLYEPCKSYHCEIIDMLISRGMCDINRGLVGACDGGHLDLAKAMAKKGASKWDQAFLAACRSGSVKLVKYVISRYRGDLAIGLDLACRYGHHDVANLMIGYGCDLNSGLYWACRGGHREVVNLMITNGASNFDAGLRGATRGKHNEIIKMMIDRGAKKLS